MTRFAPPSDGPGATGRRRNWLEAPALPNYSYGKAKENSIHRAVLAKAILTQPALRIQNGRPPRRIYPGSVCKGLQSEGAGGRTPVERPNVT